MGMASGAGMRPRVSDVIWSYVGTFFSLGSSFLLLPFLTWFLSAEDLGLWYVFLAIANLAQLFEFGFNPAFSRNFVYCLSGAKRLSVEGGGEVHTDGTIDWHLYRILLRVAKMLYAFISVVVLIAVATLGTAYVVYVSGELEFNAFVSWIIFIAAIFFNLYFLYVLSNLSGLGDISGENKAKTYSNIARLIVTAAMLLLGFGLIAASFGYLVQGVLLRMLAKRYIGQHHDVVGGIKADKRKITKSEVISTFKAIYPVAGKNGIDQLALFAATQGTSFVCSLNFTLAETGVYSIGLQFANAIATFSFAFSKAYYPAFQSAFIRSDIAEQRRIVGKCLPPFWIVSLFGFIGVQFIALPVLQLIKPASVPSWQLFALLGLYVTLLQHHTIFCNFILSTNRIPFMWPFVIFSFLGVVLSAVLSGVIGMGLPGLVLGQLLAQALFNNWYWPHFVCAELGITYVRLLIQGFKNLIPKSMPMRIGGK